jgi:hypothetical protein
MGKKSGSLFTYKSGDHLHMRPSEFLLFDRLPVYRVLNASSYHFDTRTVQALGERVPGSIIVM